MENHYAPEEPRPEPSPTRPPARSGRIWNILTGITLAAAGLVVVYVVALLVNPFLPINPFPPDPASLLPTPTPTLRSLPPTWTPTASPPAPPTSTPVPPTAEPTTFVVTLPPRPEPTTVSEEIFPVEGTPGDGQPSEGGEGSQPVAAATLARIPGTLYEADGSPTLSDGTVYQHTCQWQGVGGQVLAKDGSPALGLGVRLGGSLGDENFDQVTQTGSARVYGAAGFEFSLGSRPVASSQSLWLQLLDQSGAPISDPVYIDTGADCTQNVTLVNFKQVR